MTYVQVNRCRSSILLGWGWSFCKSELQLLSGQMVQLGKMALQVHKASFMVSGCSCVVASCSGFVCVTTLLVAVDRCCGDGQTCLELYGNIWNFGYLSTAVMASAVREESWWVEPHEVGNTDFNRCIYV